MSPKSSRIRAQEPLGAEERPSRSQRKREVAEINQLGTQLVALPPHQLDAMELDAPLHEAIERCRSLQRTARNRQIKLIGKLLRAREHLEIRDALERIANAPARSQADDRTH